MKILNDKCFHEPPVAILFDTDNTLYPYKVAHTAAYNAVRKKANEVFGVNVTDFDNTFTEARKQIKMALDGTASSHSRLLYMQRTLEIMGVGSQVFWALDFEQTYWRVFLSNAVLFENVHEFLDDVRRSKIPTAIITDLTAQIQFRKVLYFGLENYFDYIVTSEEAGFDKPHAAPFKLALEKLKVRNGKIWMIGDNSINDIMGAKVNLDAVTLQKIEDKSDVSDTANEKPDAVFQHYKHLRRLLYKVENIK